MAKLGAIARAQEAAPGAPPPGRSLRDERDHRAPGGGVIATDGEHACGGPTPNHSAKRKAITALGWSAPGCSVRGEAGPVAAR